jgi:hypothetical protein
MKSLLVPLALCASAGMAHAFETLTFGEISVTPGFGANLIANDAPDWSAP